MSTADKLPATSGTTSRSTQPHDPLALGGSSLPLLVRMPDGERHQVDVPPNTSIRDLKTTIANLSSSSAPNTAGNSLQNLAWDLDFAGSVLNDNHTLEHYNIPDTYDHANGLLRTISDSGYLHPEKKVEALDKAYAVVQSISRGERDMERLINAVFDQADEFTGFDSPMAQPSLTSMRRSKRSRIPSLNFSQLPPIGAPPSAKGFKSGLPSAPSTPSELIRRMSSFRPDLYDPGVVAKATAQYNPPNYNSQVSLPTPSLPLLTAPTQTSAAPSTSVPVVKLDATISASASAPLPSSNVDSVSSALPTDLLGSSLKNNSLPQPVVPSRPHLNSAAVDLAGSAQPEQGPDDLKRGNTWFAEVMSSFETPLLNPTIDETDENDEDVDVDGDSEGEGQDNDNSTKQAASNKNNTDILAGKSSAKPGAASAEADPANVSEQLSSQGRTKSRADGQLNSSPQGQKESGADEVEEVDDQQDLSRSDASFGVPKDGALKSSESQSVHSGLAESWGQVIGLEPEVASNVPSEQIKIPKKRGRKRKNPHLSEEERKAQRQAQNRESAKMSRIRRKNLTMEYEQRVNTLEGENENLRDTVAALTNRLEMLQNLLTISVQKRPMSGPAIDPLAPVQQMTVAGTADTGRNGLVPGVGSTVMGIHPANSSSGVPQMGPDVGGSGLLNPHAFPTISAGKMPPSSDALSNLDFSHL